MRLAELPKRQRFYLFMAYALIVLMGFAGFRISERNDERIRETQRIDMAQQERLEKETNDRQREICLANQGNRNALRIVIEAASMPDPRRDVRLMPEFQALDPATQNFVLVIIPPPGETQIPPTLADTLLPLIPPIDCSDLD